MYKIKLDKFEGPLDLLLFFVRKDELNIYDIPIAHITKSYLEYLKLMHELNLDIASEFILMAATLMRIKVRCMLPPEPGEEPEEEPLDPREELTRRLIEYRQFKDASRSLSELDDQWRMIYRRNYFDPDRLPPSEEPMGLKNISFFDLLTAYKKAVSKTNEIAVYHDVERLNVTVEQQIKYIGDFFDQRRGALFTELCEGMSKIEIVVTFLALLDMIRNELVFVRQSTVFDDIWIQKERPEEDDLPEPVEPAVVERPTEDVVPAENIMTANLSENAEPDDACVEEYELDQKKADDLYLATAESEMETPVEETELTATVEELASFPEELADISILTDQLKSPFENETTVPEEQVPGSEPVSDINEQAETVHSTEKWIDDVQVSLGHDQLNYDEVPEDEQSGDQLSETLTESLTAAVNPEIPDDQPGDSILNPDTNQTHEETESVTGGTEIAVDECTSVNMTEENEKSTLYGQEDFSDLRDEVASDAEPDDEFDRSVQETDEPEILHKNETIDQQKTIAADTCEETEQDHSGECSQDQANKAFMETVTEEALLKTEHDSPVTEASSVDNQTDNITSCEIRSGTMQAESDQASAVDREEPAMQDETVPQEQEVPSPRVDEKTDDLSETGESSLSGESEKPVAPDKSETEPRTSVIRKIFTKVLSFVKKIFKR